MQQPLDKTLRNQLERTIKQARETAETAARASLEQLGVGEATPFSHANDQERELRRKLRVHGRQLGDALNGGKVQTMDRLIEEVAYEHWHRMLPQIFRPDSPVFLLTLPPEHQQKLESLLGDLSREVFTASDSLGWVYQFWQAKRKEEVNASEVKIGARELPAITQLFTEPYMVSFLLDNSLGAWWSTRRLDKSDLQTAGDEEELRRKAAIPGVALDYLRFVQQDDGSWTTAAGTFAGWPENLSQLKTLDPCCGSGHFLVAVFLMLVPMRMVLEGLSARDAVDAVLRDNIYGLELDQRCVELAAFALALTAWKYPGAGGYRPLPDLHLACSGLSVSVAKEEWKQLGLGKKNLALALDWMHDTFRNAPVLGSLLNPAGTDAAKIVEWEELSAALDEALQQEQGEEQQEAAVVAQGLAKAAMLLAGQYHWVITNVPYLARGKQNDVLKDFCEHQYPAAKNDLATVFLDRCLELCVKGGTSSIVLPQNWLFLTSYKKFGEKPLKNDTWHLLARLGPGAFETISGEVVKAILIALSRGNAAGGRSGLFAETGVANLLRGVDVSEPRTAAEKAAGLITAEVKSVEQARQLENPDARVAFDEVSGELLEQVAAGLNGMYGADSYHFRFSFWEIKDLCLWHFFQCTYERTEHFGGKQNVFYWGANGRVHRENPKAYVKGESIWGKPGVVVSMMRDLPVTLYSGDKFDISCTPIIPHNPAHLPAIWCFCSSPKYNEAVRQIDQSLKVTNATLVKVPFDIDHWTKIAEEKYPNGLPKPYSSDPTQWIFHGHPCGSVLWDEEAKWTAHGPLRTNDTVLQIAIARLLGYRWPAELDANMEVADEQRQWVNRCERLQAYADDDGIVCIPPVRGESSAADRLLNLLTAAYGDAWSSDTLAQLLNSADYAGKSMETWLCEKFFTQHCKLFQHRTFIWHIWDGLRDGFAALVNYHKLDYKNLETLIYTYLGDWISCQKQDIGNSVDGAQEKLDAAENLKKKLELILEGEDPYDIFARWKPLKQQAIGWNPDLNDGGRLNIRPFLLVPDVGKKGAGILRDKPNIKWEKDRGKDVPSAPWYHLLNGDRINDHHLSLAEKLTAREAMK